jgi:adenylosuccinate synthase
VVRVTRAATTPATPSASASSTSRSLIPSGILHPGVQCVLGNGMVIAPEAFFSELEKLRRRGVEAEGRLFVSERATVI